MSDPSGTDPPGAEDLTRIVTEIGRLGEAAASRVVEQFAQVARIAGLTGDVDDRVDHPAADGDPTVHGPGDRADLGDPDTDLARALRTARAQAERALDSAAGAVSRSLDAVADVVDAAVRRSDTSDFDGAPLRLRVLPDGRAWGQIWLHNSSDAPTGDLFLSLGALRRHDGEELRCKVELSPAHAGVVLAGVSREVAVEVLAAPGSLAGTYHGLVLGGPDPDVALHVVVALAEDLPGDDLSEDGTRA